MAAPTYQDGRPSGCHLGILRRWLCGPNAIVEKSNSCSNVRRHYILQYFVGPSAQSGRDKKESPAAPSGTSTARPCAGDLMEFGGEMCPGQSPGSIHLPKKSKHICTSGCFHSSNTLRPGKHHTRSQGQIGLCCYAFSNDWEENKD